MTDLPAGIEEVSGNGRESAHQQLASHLASHRRDLIFSQAGLHQVSDEQLQPVGRARIASLTEIVAPIDAAFFICSKLMLTTSN